MKYYTDKTKRVAAATVITLLYLTFHTSILTYSFSSIFKEKLEETIEESVSDSMIDGDLSIRNLRVSTLNNFPSLTLSVDSLYLASNTLARRDTIFSAESVTASVNIVDYLRSSITINELSLVRPKLKLYSNGDSINNWNIFISDTTNIDETPFSFKEFLETTSIKADDISIEDGFFSMLTKESKSAVILPHIDFNFKGDIELEETQIISDIKLSEVTYIESGNILTKGTSIEFDIDTEIDILNDSLTINSGHFTYNDMPISLYGDISLIEEGVFDVDFMASCEDTDISEVVDILSSKLKLIDSNFKATGIFDLNIESKGELNLNSGSFPKSELNLIVHDGFINNISPNGDVNSQSLDSINIELNLHNAGDNKRRLLLNLNKCELFIDDKPLKAGLYADLVKDSSSVNGYIKSELNIAKIMELLGVDKDIRGIINMDFKYDIKEEDLKKNRFDNIFADGFIRVDSLYVPNLKDSTRASIENLEMTISPKIITLKKLLFKIGDSDLSVNGDINNLLHYMVLDDPVNIDLFMNSNNIDIDQLRTAFANIQEFLQSKDTLTIDKVASEAITEVLDSIAEPFIVPSNLLVNFHTKFKNLTTGDLKLKNLEGDIVVSDNQLSLNNFTMKGLGGDVVAYGTYETSNRDTLTASLGFTLNSAKIEDIKSFASTFTDSLSLDSIVAKGVITTELSIYTKTDAMYEPIVGTIDVGGRYNIPNLEVGTLANSYKIDSLSGNIVMSDNILTIGNMRCKIFDGYAGFDGDFDFSVEDSISSEMNLYISDWDIQNSYKKIAPAIDYNPNDFNLEGDVSSSLILSMIVDSEYRLIDNTLSATGDIESNRFYLKRSPALQELLDSLEVPKFEEFDFTNAYIKYNVEDRVLNIEPSTVRLNKFLAFAQGSINTSGDMLIGFLVDLNKNNPEEGEGGSAQVGVAEDDITTPLEASSDSLSTADSTENELSNKEQRKIDKEKKKSEKQNRTLKGTVIMFGNLLEDYDYKIKMKLNRVKGPVILQEYMDDYQNYAPERSISNAMFTDFLEMSEYISPGNRPDSLISDSLTVQISDSLLIANPDTLTTTPSDTLLINSSDSLKSIVGTTTDSTIVKAVKSAISSDITEIKTLTTEIKEIKDSIEITPAN